MITCLRSACVSTVALYENAKALCLLSGGEPTIFREFERHHEYENWSRV